MVTRFGSSNLSRLRSLDWVTWIGYKILTRVTSFGSQLLRAGMLPRGRLHTCGPTTTVSSFFVIVVLYQCSGDPPSPSWTPKWTTKWTLRSWFSGTLGEKNLLGTRQGPSRVQIGKFFTLTFRRWKNSNFQSGLRSFGLLVPKRNAFENILFL